MVFLSFDFDEEESEDMKKFIEQCLDMGIGDDVYVRHSSSGVNWHVKTSISLPPKSELHVREHWGDCKGRCIADTSRIKAGLKSSRLFRIKTTIDIKTGEKTFKEAGEWITATKWYAEHHERI